MNYGISSGWGRSGSGAMPEGRIDPPDDGPDEDTTETMTRVDRYFLRDGVVWVRETWTTVDTETREVLSYGKKWDHRPNLDGVYGERFRKWCAKRPRVGPKLLAAAGMGVAA